MVFEQAAGVQTALGGINGNEGLLALAYPYAPSVWPFRVFPITGSGRSFIQRTQPATFLSSDVLPSSAAALDFSKADVTAGGLQGATQEFGAYQMGFGDLSPVPEPTTLLLFGTTAVGLGRARWKKRGQSV